MAISFDGADVTAAQASGTSPVSLGAYLTTNTNQMLVVAVGMQSDTLATITGVTVNGVAMTFALRSDETAETPQARVELWYMLDAQLPSGTGSATVAISFSPTLSAGGVVMGAAIQMHGVAQQAPEATASTHSSSNTTTISTGITTVTNNAWVVDVVMGGTGTGAWTATAGQTGRTDELAGSAQDMATSTKAVASAGATTLGWTNSVTQGRRVQALAAFAEATGNATATPAATAVTVTRNVPTDTVTATLAATTIIVTEPAPSGSVVATTTTVRQAIVTSPQASGSGAGGSATATPSAFAAIVTSPQASATGTVSGITFDVATPGGAGSATSPVAFSHTIGSGAARLLVVAVGIEASDPTMPTITGVTYNGVAMTFGVQANETSEAVDAHIELWYMLAASLPAAGTYTVSIAFTGTPTNGVVQGAAVSLAGVNQAAPEATAAANSAIDGTTTTANITTLTANAWVIDGVFSGTSVTWTSNAGQTGRTDESVAPSQSLAMSTKPVVSAGATTLGWTASVTMNRWVQALAAFAPSGGGSATATPAVRQVVVTSPQASATGSFTDPNSLTDLTAWYDGSDTGAGAVSSWTNKKTGSTLHATQSGTARPTSGTRTIGTLNCLDFDGTDDYLNVPTTIMGGATAGTAYYVFAIDADPPGASHGAVLEHWGQHVAIPTYGDHEPYQDGVIYSSWGSNARKTVGDPTPSLTAVHVVSIVSSSTEWTYYLDGTAIFTTATNTVFWDTTTGPCIGGDSGLWHLDGRIGEIITCNTAHDATTRTTVNNYLQRWIAAAGSATATPSATAVSVTSPAATGTGSSSGTAAPGAFAGVVTRNQPTGSGSSPGTGAPGAFAVVVTRNQPSATGTINATATPAAFPVVVTRNQPPIKSPPPPDQAGLAPSAADYFSGLIPKRFESVRFDVVDRYDNAIGQLAVDPTSAPTISNDVSRSIRRALDGLRVPSRPISDQDPTRIYAEDLNVLTMHLRPYWVLASGESFPLGEFVFSDDSRVVWSWGAPREVSCGDRMVDLDQDLPESFSVNAGEIVSDAIHRFLDMAAVRSATVSRIIEATTVAVAEPIAWAAGRDTALKVIEGLCALAGFLPPYFDNTGTFICRSAPELSAAIPDFEYGYGIGAVLTGSIVRSNDILAAPNRYVALSTSSTDVAIVGIFDIPDTAPHSFANTGRRRVRTVELQGLESEASARDAAAAAYAADSSTYSWLAFETPADPRHDTWNVISFDGVNYRQLAWSLDLIPGGVMSHDTRGAYSA